jgi:hypothetical protein
LPPAAERQENRDLIHIQTRLGGGVGLFSRCKAPVGIKRRQRIDISAAPKFARVAIDDSRTVSRPFEVVQSIEIISIVGQSCFRLAKCDENSPIECCQVGLRLATLRLTFQLIVGPTPKRLVNGEKASDIPP